MKQSPSKIGLLRAGKQIGSLFLALLCVYFVTLHYRRYQNYRYFTTHYEIEKAEVINAVSGSDVFRFTRLVKVTFRPKTSDAPPISFWPPSHIPDDEVEAVLTDKTGKEWAKANIGAQGGDIAEPGCVALFFSGSRSTDIPQTSFPFTVTMKLWVGEHPVFISTPAKPKIGRWNNWFYQQRSRQHEHQIHAVSSHEKISEKVG